jgi:hypothetical protein
MNVVRSKLSGIQISQSQKRNLGGMIATKVLETPSSLKAVPRIVGSLPNLVAHKW